MTAIAEVGQKVYFIARHGITAANIPTVEEALYVGEMVKETAKNVRLKVATGTYYYAKAHFVFFQSEAEALEYVCKSAARACAILEERREKAFALAKAASERRLKLKALQMSSQVEQGQESGYTPERAL